ncbi:hypothetical protein GCM10011348_44410 [Marinobacterium nitratireducens]|uniref:DUF6351 domain-containing protein n=1 Tax=Marinobacterium nitratireducens TaxID=518897 RepID=A0A918DYC0_9GAMM|nr:DUF6351 family protein [Marinobacterium nitratireducens]GGO88596.1 hypothetical protein GCM10011348_44410 [Marinobacterium nitratireducens]
MKATKIALLVLVPLLGLATWFWYQIPDYLPNNRRYLEMPLVVGTPPLTYKPQPSYQGPPPSEWTRPQDPYPYPILPGQVGPHQPLYAGPLQYPFACDGEDSGLGQPLVDNQDGFGIRVYATDAEGHHSKDVIGYSKDCLHPTRVRYYYNRSGTRQFFPLEEADGDIERIRLGDREIDFVVRVETGTINRFIYSIVMLKGPDDEAAQPDLSYWNRNLIYQFRGGVGIGYRQGRLRETDLPERRYDQLRRGFAIAYSTGNQTSNHYNIWLAEETALRVKSQFRALYGEPSHTLGIGGSGGAIQQYLIAQNGSGLLDAGLALYAYPDMLTQTIYAFDCELLEYYFDQQAPDTWSWPSRRLVAGLNSRNGIHDSRTWLYELAMVIQGRAPRWPLGGSECSHAWRGLTPLVNNPRFVHFSPRFTPEVQRQVHWTHWQDLRGIYGADENGYARQTWDNVGVQYGLQALRDGQLSPRTFLHLNANIGGWKNPGQMKQERFWHLNGDKDLLDFSPWSHHNMRLSPDGGRTPAPRTHGDPEAIRAAVRAGIVFTGELPIPIIDLRHYLEPALDMHHASAAFSTRLRLQLRGYAANQLIWMAPKPYDPTDRGFDVLLEWLDSEHRPASAQDACFTEDGELLAEGEHVWDGGWNGRPDGTCMQRYPIYGTPRTVAGEDLRGDLFKCHLVSVDDALAHGLYGSVDMNGYRNRLQHIFPDGVCDYSVPGLGQITP